MRTQTLVFIIAILRSLPLPGNDEHFPEIAAHFEPLTLSATNEVPGVWLARSVSESKWRYKPERVLSALAVSTNSRLRESCWEMAIQNRTSFDWSERHISGIVSEKESRLQRLALKALSITNASRLTFVLRRMLIECDEPGRLNAIDSISLVSRQEDRLDIWLMASKDISPQCRLRCIYNWNDVANQEATVRVFKEFLRDKNPALSRVSLDLASTVEIREAACMMMSRFTELRSTAVNALAECYHETANENDRHFHIQLMAAILRLDTKNEFASKLMLDWFETAPELKIQILKCLRFQNAENAKLLDFISKNYGELNVNARVFACQWASYSSDDKARSFLSGCINDKQIEVRATAAIGLRFRDEDDATPVDRQRILIELATIGWNTDEMIDIEEVMGLVAMSEGSDKQAFHLLMETARTHPMVAAKCHDAIRQIQLQRDILLENESPWDAWE